MTLQQLKEAIIKDETEFIVEMHEDANSEPQEIEAAIDELTSEINSCQTPDELVCFYLRRGFDESEAANMLFVYLIEK